MLKMASQSSQESVGSRQGKVTTIVPERSRFPSRRRLAKRQTTLRAFTFVRDWDVRQSPLASVHSQPADKSEDSASPARSSVTISPSPQLSSQAASLSTSGRPRVSPGPIIIASPSSRTRSGSTQKRPPSSHRTTRHGLASTSAGGHATAQSGESMMQSSTVGRATLSEPTGPSATSTPASGDPGPSSEGASQMSLDEDSSLTTSAQTGPPTGHSSPITDGSRPTVTSELASQERPVIAANPLVMDSPTASSTLSQPVSSSPALSIQNLGQRPSDMPSVQWRVDHSQFTTPGEKSMSIIAKTPKSGPVARHVTSRRRKLSPPPEGDRQQSIIAPGTKKAKVRLWAGNGRRRLATDVTDLDMVLSTLEDVIVDYKQKLESASQKRALTKFFYLMKKELTNKIDLGQEYKVLKSGLTRMTATMRKQRRKLLLLQQENARLNSRIRELKDSAMNKRDKSQEMAEISTFLGDLQQFHQDNIEPTSGDKGEAQLEFSSQNIGPLLASGQASSRSEYNLRSVNDKLQQWLDTH
ncbi:centromere protein U-like [Acanthaster planci]|uniref:Centromere protein U n=1 Tax=Acanthaster planci TaxID=133434 RepID=A0A8B7XJV6_ACAPL|nr:centromere protein U-like [Acanthaster planci]